MTGLEVERSISGNFIFSGEAVTGLEVETVSRISYSGDPS